MSEERNDLYASDMYAGELYDTYLFGGVGDDRNGKITLSLEIVYKEACEQ